MRISNESPRSSRIATALVFAVLAVRVPAQVDRFAELAFEPLFDGRTLAGWTERGGRYDGNADWTVEDGAITGREGPNHAGGLLYTERRYGSFVFSCEVRMTYPFDSGIFVRMVPRGGGRGAQVTLDYRPDGEIGAIYSDGFLSHNAEGKALFRKDAWNRVEVRCVGHPMHVQAWLNGRKIADHRIPDEAGFAPIGRIGLQVHGNRDDPEGSVVRFRDVKIHELPTFDSAMFRVDAGDRLTPVESARRAGWRPLFDGKTLRGWEVLAEAADGFVVADGELRFPVTGHDGYLRTAEDFEDFELRLDFAIERLANSGLFLRGDRRGGNPAFSGCEIQILDDFNWERATGSTLKPWQFTGSLYGSSPPRRRDALFDLGRWNTYEVRFVGPRLTVRLNGAVIQDLDVNQAPLESTEARPFAERAASGFIGLQRHAPAASDPDTRFHARFRNLFVRSIAGGERDR